MTKVLACDCADCLHWEVVETEHGIHLHCKTCGHRFPITLDTAKHTKLKWVDREE